MTAVSSGLPPRRIAQPDHQVRLKRRGRSEPDVPCGVVLAAVGRAPFPARPQRADGRVGRRQTAVAVGGVLRVPAAIRRRIPDRRPVRHRRPRRARHGEGGAVVGHVRVDPPRSPPVRDESIAVAVAGHIGAEILRRRCPRAPLRRRAKARRAGRRPDHPAARRAATRPGGAGAAGPGGAGAAGSAGAGAAGPAGLVPPIPPGATGRPTGAKHQSARDGHDLCSGKRDSRHCGPPN